MRTLFVIAFMLSGFALQAGTRGTLRRTDIAELLASDNSQLKRVLADFDVACVGDARMINRAENVKLNGIRIGPYDFPAKPKGNGERFCYVLHIETKCTFLDSSDHAVPLGRATDAREVITAISLSPEPPDKCFVQRPDQCE